MVLEATMICVDNSEWMRNGDYAPTRFQAQSDAINFLAGAKTQDNPENTVGVLSLAGKGPRVLVTPTADLGKVLGAMHGLGMESEANITSGVQVAQLALKHRQNKNQRQRIVLFLGSPVAADQAALVKIGKKLKKNNVAVDIVSFGDPDNLNTEKLEAFLEAVNSNDNSHLVTVPLGAVLADFLLSSPIFTEGRDANAGFEAGAAGAGAGGGDFGEFGFERVDPNLDPELALALRVSMEEERARQEAAAKKAAEEGGEASGSVEAAGVATPMEDTPSQPAEPPASEDIPMDEDALLQQALALSMQEAAMDVAPSAEPEPEGTAGAAGMDTDIPGETDEDAELALAIQMSMADSSAQQGEGAPALDASMAQVLGDASFVNSVLADLPGVDPNNPAVRDVLASLGAGPDEEGEKKEDKEEEEK